MQPPHSLEPFANTPQTCRTPGPVGAAAVAEAISIAPALIYSTQTGDSLAAIGIDIVRAHTP